MLFKNILDDKYRKMLPVFDQLLNMSLKNQPHDGDLLLVSENAGYDKDAEKADNLPFKPDHITPDHKWKAIRKIRIINL
jgi:hypothetical protein